MPVLSTPSTDIPARPCFFSKACRAVLDFPHTLRTTPKPRLIMTYLVKNEEDILEQGLLFHKKMGVDGFIVTDNNSTDRTPQILQKYRELGWVLDIINDPSDNYQQKRAVDRMAWLAKTRHKADWIINADADEFWYAPCGNLKEELCHTHATQLVCGMVNVFPEEEKPWAAWQCTIHPVSDTSPYDLPRYNLFEQQGHKVLHRANGYLQISMGNHKVLMLPSVKRASRIIIYHYGVRGLAHFTHKMVAGGQAIERNPSKHGARHWRYFYDLYKRGLLTEEYARITGRHCHDLLVRDGVIVADNPVPGILTGI